MCSAVEGMFLHTSSFPPADTQRTLASLTNPVVYASPLVTLTRRGYTKHYFEGERRICSAIGGGFSHMEWDLIDATQDKVVAPICDELFPLCRIYNLQCSPSGMNNPYNKN